MRTEGRPEGLAVRTDATSDLGEGSESVDNDDIRWVHFENRCGRLAV
jgi:hypothetical protein